MHVNIYIYMFFQSGIWLLRPYTPVPSRDEQNANNAAVARCGTWLYEIFVSLCRCMCITHVYSGTPNPLILKRRAGRSLGRRAFGRTCTVTRLSVKSDGCKNATTFLRLRRYMLRGNFTTLFRCLRAKVLEVLLPQRPEKATAQRLDRTLEVSRLYTRFTI